MTAYGQMQKRAAYRDYVFTLAAGVPQSIRVVGDYFQIIQSAGKVGLSFDDAPALTRSQGQGGPASYSAVTLSSATAQTVTVSLGQLNGSAPPYDNSLTSFGGTVNVLNSVSDQCNPLADVAVPSAGSAVLAAASATRRSLVIKLPGTAANAIRIGDATVGAAKGVMLEPGDAVTLDGTAAVSAYNPGGAPVTVTLLSLDFI